MKVVKLTPWRLVVISVFLAILGALLYTLMFSAAMQNEAISDERDKAASELELHAAIAEGYFSEYRALPAIIARDKVIINYLKNLPSEAPERLKEYALLTSASEVYLTDIGGEVILNSKNLNAIKHYPSKTLVQRAGLGGLARETMRFEDGDFAQFALPIRDNDAVLGIVVVEFSVFHIETDIRNSLYDIALYSNTGREIIDFENAQIRDSFEFNPADRTHDIEWLTRPLAAEPFSLHLGFDQAPIIDAAWRRVLLFASLIALTLLSLGLIGSLILMYRSRFLERQSAAARLELLVAERTQALEQSLVNLKQTQSDLVQAGKMAALGQMSAQLSHEYNQPLQAMRSYTENAIALISKGKMDVASENLKRVMTLTERMAKLSQHLIRFSRRSKADIGRADLVRVIHETLDLMAGRIEKAGAEIVLDVPKEAWVLGGEVRLQHVFLNLISNAIDAVPPHRTPLVRIRVVGSTFTIQDNGNGISQESKDHIFDPFFTTKEAGKGLGLGLSITYNIVQDFEGQISIVETGAEGTTFRVELKSA